MALKKALFTLPLAALALAACGDDKTTTEEVIEVKTIESEVITAKPEDTVETLKTTLKVTEDKEVLLLKEVEMKFYEGNEPSMYNKKEPISFIVVDKDKNPYTPIKVLVTTATDEEKHSDKEKHSDEENKVEISIQNDTFVLSNVKTIGEVLSAVTKEAKLSVNTSLYYVKENEFTKNNDSVIVLDANKNFDKIYEISIN